MAVKAVERESVPGALPPGSALGRYQIIKRLAMGGMAELYLARQTGDGGYEKIVALKRVLPHLTEDISFVHMFLNEAKLAAGLSHSNIAHVMDFGSEGGEHFMVMEYVHGRSVQDILRAGARHGGTPRTVALTIVHEVAAALHYAHECAGVDGRPLGLVHRDVSPSNVLVSFEGDVKLVDFGIAKATAHTRVTRSGAIKGKLAYMAPEQVRGEQVDRRADVFSLAVVAYELCTGRRCFSAPGDFALINRVAEGRYERPSAADPDFPPELEALLARGLAVDPADRFETAREMQRAVEAFAAGSGDRVSRLALSEYLDLTFGQEPYPTTQMLPPVSASQSRSEARTFVAPLSQRRRTSLVLIAGALALGLLVGLGGPALFGDGAESNVGTNAVEQARHGGEAGAGPAGDRALPVTAEESGQVGVGLATVSGGTTGKDTAGKDTAGKDTGSPPIDPDDDPQVATAGADTLDDRADPPPPHTRGKRAKRRRRRDGGSGRGSSKGSSKPSPSEPKAGGGSKPPEYLPPSRRGG
ncbi:MAG: serine/threonine protein kinase [Nannocystaceae bacterium]|nr:serine/threonine protein kinase [Nannocystaceae bacterium]